MASKTYAALTAATDMQDGDLLASYRSTGPMKSVTALITSAYFATKLLGNSGHVAGYLDGANTWSALQTHSINTSTTAADYTVLQPTDFGVGKPGLFISKEASALLWRLQLFDGATVAGQLDVNLTLLNITGALTLSGVLTASGGAVIGGGLTLTGGQTFTGSTKQNVTAMAALDIDVSAGEFFTKSISSPATFTISNPTATKGQAFLFQLIISSAATTTWPASVKWTAGIAPILGNGVHVLGFITFDGGTTWDTTVFVRAAA